MAEKLSKYNQKRDFNKTNEPTGANHEKAEKLRFVVQHHMARKEHYDLRLEWEGVMLSWAVPKGPSFNPADKRLAVHVEDHPLEYRHFEGTIPKGEYGGGTVMIWDEGHYEPYADIAEGFIKGNLKFTLCGSRLKGRFALIRLKKDEKEKDNWLLVKDKDEFAETDSGISDYTTSIRTGRTMDEITNNLKARKSPRKITRNPFATAPPQLAKLVSKVPAADIQNKDKNWLYEFKYDGYRIVSYLENNSVRLLTRNGNDYADRFQDVKTSLINFAAGRAMVLDGEMVIIDKDGRTDFGALQSYLKNPQGKNLTYIIFDLLALDGKDLRALPLIRRKEMLEKLLKGAPPNIHYSRHVINAGEESMAIAEKMNMEGIIGKKAESLYSGLRNGDWIKLKCDKRQEFVIGGFTVSDKSASGLSSLLLGAYEEDELTYIGRAGTGFTENSAKEILAKFKKLIRKISPFKEPPKARANEGITWLKPTMMAEIKFAEWTKDHKLRQASFKGLRDDKDAKEVKLEIAENIEAEEEKIKKNTGVTKSKKAGNDTDVTVQSIKITNPAKVLYDEPVITKIDVIRYYEQVAEVMLPYISERIISAVRCPKGVSGTCFFKKHPEANRQGIKTFGDYFYIDDIVGLISEAQMGTLEFHTWGSQVSEIENPDIIVFDLDPDEGMELKTIRRGVRDIRSVLNDLSLNSYLKTSGGKGYHIVVPLKPTASWEVVRDFCKSVVDVMEKKWPDRYTSNSRKVNRKGKIFIDWLRNTRGATSIAPYSLRARQGAKVSMPISWDELSKIAPDGIDMYTALRRIKTKDPWHDFFRNEQGLR